MKEIVKVMLVLFYKIFKIYNFLTLIYNIALAESRKLI
jgi:hypothetical protein